MTLRVTIEIVPFGRESQKYTVGFVNIHNVGKGIDGYNYRYEGQYAKYPSNKVNAVEGVVTNHDRINESVLDLIAKVIDNREETEVT